MNAPASTIHMAEPRIEHLPLTSIAESGTEIQKLRRQKYDATALEELAASIRENGMLMPIVVRPLPSGDIRGDFIKYELVAGERRYLAAGKAGQEHVLARIIELGDDQVLKAQLVENIHREGLDVMAEAQGLRELLAQGVPADAIGDVIGKSRSYVYARTRLLELSEPVKEKLKTGEIDASQALVYARVPLKLQPQALKYVEQRSYGKDLTFRKVADLVNNDKLFLSLSKAPFSVDDANYFEFKPSGKRGVEDAIALPTCTACPKRSGNDPELLGALEDPNVCTDRLCHDVKVKAEYKRRRENAEREGRVVLTGDAAAAVVPSQFGNRGGMLDLDEECGDDLYPEPQPKTGADGKKLKYDAPEFIAYEERADKWKSRSFRQLLSEDLATLTLTLAEDPKTKRLIELAPEKEVGRVLKQRHGIKCTFYKDRQFEERRDAKPEKPKDPEAARRAEEKAARAAEKEAQERAAAELDQKIDSEFHERLFKAAHEAFKGPLKRDELELVAEHLLTDWDFQHTVGRLLKKKPAPGNMNERDLARLIVVGIVGHTFEGEGDARPLIALGKRLKIDTKALRKEVADELTPKEEGEGAARKKPAPKSKRK